ncbi:MAG: DUF3307 domain-containing protein [Niabella sp.]
MILFLQLILAHLIADFILQPATWVYEKERLQLKSTKFYWHLALHFLCMMLLTWDAKLMPLITVITVIHGTIDYLKIKFQHQHKRTAFFLDQVLHVLAIAAAVWFYEGANINTIIWHDAYLPVITGLVWLTIPCSIVIRIIISSWSSQMQFKSTDIETKSLQSAGKIIGILERILVFIFILVNHWEAVGFLITAKSVFRFSDLKLAQDRKLTEYILIGTLLSFGIAIVTGIITKYLIAQISI